MAERKHRSDYGTVQTTERDIYLLTWIVEQYAVQVDQLQELMGRWRGEPVSFSAVKWLLQRWKKADWVKAKKILAGKPQWVWVSRTGLREMGFTYPYWTPAIGRLKHIYYVNAVRLYAQGKQEGQLQWVSERRINPRRKRAEKRHLVDGEVIYQGTRIAVEVELTLKSEKRLTSVLAELQQDYEAVWYFVAEECYQPVKAAIERIPRHEETFVIYRLDRLVPTM